MTPKNLSSDGGKIYKEINAFVLIFIYLIKKNMTTTQETHIPLYNQVAVILSNHSV